MKNVRHIIYEKETRERRTSDIVYLLTMQYQNDIVLLVTKVAVSCTKQPFKSHEETLIPKGKILTHEESLSRGTFVLRLFQFIGTCKTKLIFYFSDILF